MILLDTYVFRGHDIRAYATTETSEIWYYEMATIFKALGILGNKLVEHCELCDILSELGNCFADDLIDYLEEGEY